MRQSDIELQRMMILIAIRDGSTRDKWLTAREIAEATGLSGATVSRRLKALSREGKIYHSIHKKRSSAGYNVKFYRWNLVPKVREAIERGVVK